MLKNIIKVIQLGHQQHFCQQLRMVLLILLIGVSVSMPIAGASNPMIPTQKLVTMHNQKKERTIRYRSDDHGYTNKRSECAPE